MFPLRRLAFCCAFAFVEAALDSQSQSQSHAQSVASLHQFLDFLLDAGTRDISCTIVLDTIARMRLAMLRNFRLPSNWTFFMLRVLSFSEETRATLELRL